AAHADRHALVHEHAFVVRPAVSDDVAHAMNERARLVGVEGRARFSGFYEASDAAHLWSLVPGSWCLVRPGPWSLVRRKSLSRSGWPNATSSIVRSRVMRRVASPIQAMSTIGLVASRQKTAAIRSVPSRRSVTRTVVVFSRRP